MGGRCVAATLRHAGRATRRYDAPKLMKHLRPIPTPHPAIAIVSLVIISGMIYWGLRTDLREPAMPLSMAVILLIIVVNEASRRSRSRQQSR